MAKVEVTIQLKRTLMDAQGITINKALHNLGYETVRSVRIGKFIELEIEGDDPEQTEKQVSEMCEKLLANPIIEDYRVKASTGNPHWEVREPRAAYAAKPRVEDWRGFHLSVSGYEELDWKAKGDLHWEFQQLHGDWIQEQLTQRESEWILMAAGDVVQAGPHWHGRPDDCRLAELSHQYNRMYWVFGRFPLIEESSWNPVTPVDLYPSLAVTVVGNTSTGETVEYLADFDSGSSTTVLDATRLQQAGFLGGRLERVETASHLGEPFQFSWRPLTLRLRCESGEERKQVVECCIVYCWAMSPWTRINPKREALAGRDLLLRFPASVELDGITKRTYIRKVQPQ